MTITRLSLAKTRLRYSYCFGACRDTTKRRPGRGSDFAFRSRPLMRLSLPQPSHELVQGAFAAAITGQPHTSQDFGAREVRPLAPPLRDLRLVQRQVCRRSTPFRSRSLISPEIASSF